MRVFVHKETCISCGLCQGACPEVFSLKTGVAVATSEELSDHVKFYVEIAHEHCPVKAISIEK